MDLLNPLKNVFRFCPYMCMCIILVHNIHGPSERSVLYIILDLVRVETLGECTIVKEQSRSRAVIFVSDPGV